MCHSAKNTTPMASIYCSPLPRAFGCRAEAPIAITRKKKFVFLRCELHLARQELVLQFETVDDSSPGGGSDNNRLLSPQWTLPVPLHWSECQDAINVPRLMRHKLGSSQVQQALSRIADTANAMILFTGCTVDIARGSRLRILWEEEGKESRWWLFHIDFVQFTPTHAYVGGHYAKGEHGTVRLDASMLYALKKGEQEYVLVEEGRKWPSPQSQLASAYLLPYHSS